MNAPKPCVHLSLGSLERLLNFCAKRSRTKGAQQDSPARRRKGIGRLEGGRESKRVLPVRPGPSTALGTVPKRAFAPTGHDNKPVLPRWGVRTFRRRHPGRRSSLACPGLTCLGPSARSDPPGTFAARNVQNTLEALRFLGQDGELRLTKNWDARKTCGNAKLRHEWCCQLL